LNPLENFFFRFLVSQINRDHFDGQAVLSTRHLLLRGGGGEGGGDETSMESANTVDALANFVWRRRREKTPNLEVDTHIAQEVHNDNGNHGGSVTPSLEVDNDNVRGECSVVIVPGHQLNEDVVLQQHEQHAVLQENEQHDALQQQERNTVLQQHEHEQPPPPTPLTTATTKEAAPEQQPPSDELAVRVLVSAVLARELQALGFFVGEPSVVVDGKTTAATEEELSVASSTSDGDSGRWQSSPEVVTNNNNNNNDNDGLMVLPADAGFMELGICAHISL
jgi:hypothetical protein